MRRARRHGGRGLLIASSAALAALGLPLTWAPQEVAAGLGIDHPLAAVLLQLWGAALLGGAVTHWMGRGLVVGGIYGRALVLGNLAHWSAGALLLWRGQAPADLSIAFHLLCLMYTLFALGFLWLTFHAPAGDGSV